MNKLSSSLTYAAVATTLSLGAFGVTPAHAVGFSGNYDPSNFTLLNTNADGSVNTTSAPGSITLVGGNNGSLSAGATDYTIAAAASGVFSFDWDYLTTDVDGPTYDPFSVLINGIATQLTNNSGANSQISSYSATVNLGDTIGWRINTDDNRLGAAQVTISNFSPPGATSVPEPFTMIGTFIGGTAALRMRKKLTSKS